MIENELKEDCDRMSEKDLKVRVKTLCKENGLPTTGWKFYFCNYPGPRCLRRYAKGNRTHTAYIQPFWIDIYAEGNLTPIAKGGLA